MVRIQLGYKSACVWQFKPSENIQKYTIKTHGDVARARVHGHCLSENCDKSNTWAASGKSHRKEEARRENAQI